MVQIWNSTTIDLYLYYTRILEKLYNKRLAQFIDKNNILSTSQYGFRTNMSTSHALIDLVEEISTSLDKKKYTLGVFIDLKIAFDTVNNSVLIEKLKLYGIRGVTENWIKSYLYGRKQFVNIGECSSDLIQISCGVPQGSVLGPKLFILYIIDIYLTLCRRVASDSWRHPWQLLSIPLYLWRIVSCC